MRKKRKSRAFGAVAYSLRASAQIIASKSSLVRDLAKKGRCEKSLQQLQDAEDEFAYAYGRARGYGSSRVLAPAAKSLDAAARSFTRRCGHKRSGA